MINGKVVDILQKSNPSPKGQKKKEKDTKSFSLIKETLLNCLQQWDAHCSSFTLEDVKINTRVQQGLQEFSCPIFYSHKLQHLYSKEDQLLQLLQSSITHLQSEEITSVTIDNHFINYHTNIPAVPKSDKPSSTPTPSTSSSSAPKPRSFRMELVPATKENGADVFELYQEFERDQFAREENSFDHFFNFLGGNGLVLDMKNKLGIFWWKWYIDDELIAVSVLDILPDVIVSQMDGTTLLK